MPQLRILPVSIVLILVWTLACGLIRGPFETSIPPVPASETTIAPDALLVQIGHFNSLNLRYDANEWEAFNEFQDQRQNSKGEPVNSLRHRSIPGCILHDNLGRGAPPSWELQDTNRAIGSLEYRVEAWTDTETQKPVLTVYQYPAAEPGTGTRIELVIDQDPEKCIQSAEEVLSLSSDLIAASQ
jgi:hypothetical protein